MPLPLNRQRVQRLRTLGMADGESAPAVAEIEKPDPMVGAIEAFTAHATAQGDALKEVVRQLAADPRPTRWKFTVTRRDAQGRIAEMDVHPHND